LAVQVEIVVLTSYEISFVWIISDFTSCISIGAARKY
jgi:hypothetical protein